MPIVTKNKHKDGSPYLFYLGKVNRKKVIKNTLELECSCGERASFIITYGKKSNYDLMCETPSKGWNGWQATKDGAKCPTCIYELRQQQK